MRGSYLSQVTLYTIPGCARCERARAFLAEHRIRFTEINVLTKPKLLLRVLAHRHRVFPVIAVDNRILTGFDRRKLAAAVGLRTR